MADLNFIDQNLFPDSWESKINLFLFLSIKNVCLRRKRIYWGLFRGSFQILNSGRWKCGKSRQTWSFIKRPKRMPRKMFNKYEQQKKISRAKLDKIVYQIWINRSPICLTTLCLEASNMVHIKAHMVPQAPFLWKCARKSTWTFNVKFYYFQCQKLDFKLYH